MNVHIIYNPSVLLELKLHSFMSSTSKPTLKSKENNKSSSISAKQRRNKYLRKTTPLLENVAALQAALPEDNELMMAMLKRSVSKSLFQGFVNSCEVRVVLHVLRVLSVWFSQNQMMGTTNEGKKNIRKFFSSSFQIIFDQSERD